MESMGLTPGFWRGKRVLLTGHTGFKGGWLSLWLHSLGAKVHGYALPPPTAPSFFVAANVEAAMSGSTIADIRDYSKLLRAVSEFQPEIVFHLAAQPLVRYSYDYPAETYEVNVLGLVNLLEAVRANGGVRAVVNVTSDKCYENREWLWGYRESEPMGGYDPYSSSKGCAELVSAAYRRSFFESSGVALATGRAGNVIGGGDWAADRLVPDMVRAVVEGRPVLIRNPQSVRPWQHVLEPLAGYLRLAECLYEKGNDFAEAWNFGPNESDTLHVQDIVQRFVELWGDGAHWVSDPESHQPHEAAMLKLDCSKAKARLNWYPHWTLDRSLEKIVEWYKACMRGDDMHQLSLLQIAAYQEQA